MKHLRKFNETKQVPPGPNVLGANCIKLTDADLEDVKNNPVLTDLITKQKLAIIKNELWFRISDADTVEAVETYFPVIYSKTIGYDEENESLKINEGFGYNVYSTDDEIHGKYNKKIPAAKRKIFANIYNNLYDIASDVQFTNYSGGIQHLDVNLLADIERVTARAADHIATLLQDAGERSIREFEGEESREELVEESFRDCTYFEIGDKVVLSTIASKWKLGNTSVPQYKVDGLQTDTVYEITDKTPTLRVAGGDQQFVSVNGLSSTYPCWAFKLA